MKSAAGQKIVQDVHKQVNLEKKTPQGHDVVDTALIHVLQLRMQDYGNSAKKHASGDRRKAIDAEFLRCASEFVEPTKKKLEEKCYEMYCADAALNNAVPLPRDAPVPHCSRKKKLRMEISKRVHAPVCARGGSEGRAISLLESED